MMLGYTAQSPMTGLLGDLKKKKIGGLLGGEGPGAEKPRRNLDWNAALHVLGAGLRDLDGTLGSNNLATAQQLVAQRHEQQQAEQERQRRQDALQSLIETGQYSPEQIAALRANPDVATKLMTERAFAEAKPQTTILSDEEERALNLPTEGVWQKGPDGAISAAYKPESSPSAIREYEYAVGQGYKGTFADFQQAQRKAGATNITLGGPTFNEPEAVDPFIKAFGEERAKGQADAYAAARESAKAAEGNIQVYNRMEQLLDEGLRTGGYAPLLRTAGQWLGQDVGDMEEFTALSGQQLLGQTQKMAGVLSDTDMKVLNSTIPNLSDTPEGLRQIIDYNKAVDQRAIEYYTAMDNWIAKRGSPQSMNEDGKTFEQVWRQYAQDNPLFEGEPGGGERPAPQSGQPRQISSDEEYNALPSGAVFIGPDGKKRRKP